MRLLANFADLLGGCGSGSLGEGLLRFNRFCLSSFATLVASSWAFFVAETNFSLSVALLSPLYSLRILSITDLVSSAFPLSSSAIV